MGGGIGSNSPPQTQAEYNQRQIDHALRQAKISVITSMTAATAGLLAGANANQINLANSTAGSVVENNLNLHQIKAIQLMELAGEVPIGTTAAAMEQSAQATMQAIDIATDLYALAEAGPQGVAAKKVVVESVKQGIKKGAEKLLKKVTAKINKVEKIDTPVGGKIIEHASSNTTKATKATNNIPNKAENLPTLPSEIKIGSGKGINGPGPTNSVFLPNVIKNEHSARDIIIADPLITKRYLKEIKDITGKAVTSKQISLLKKDLQNQEFKKLDKISDEQHRKIFNNTRKKLISDWEINTGQTWPVYKTHPNIDRIGRPYDAHHIIKSNYGGPKNGGIFIQLMG